jgi:hypothetical protein
MSKEEELVSLSGSHTWVLKDVLTKLVNRFPEVNDEFSIRERSPAFDCAGHQWVLQIVMSRKVDNGQISVNLYLRTFHDDHEVECGAAIWNNKTVLIAWSKRMVTSEGWGVTNAWTEKQLKKIADEKNEIVLSVQITAKSDQSKEKEKEKDIVLKPVLNPFPFDEKFSDLTIKTIDSAEFKVHKVVLAHRSSVFAAMFSWPIKESKESKESKEGVIDVKETGNIMHALLEFMYSGSLTRTQSLQNMTDASRLFEASLFYDVPEVALAAIPIIEKHLSAINALATLKLGSMYKPNKAGSDLYQVVTMWIRQNLDAFLVQQL